MKKLCVEHLETSQYYVPVKRKAPEMLNIQYNFIIIREPD